jgi:hypothetical protein
VGDVTSTSSSAFQSIELGRGSCIFRTVLGQESQSSFCLDNVHNSIRKRIVVQREAKKLCHFKEGRRKFMQLVMMQN